MCERERGCVRVCVCVRECVCLGIDGGDLVINVARVRHCEQLGAEHPSIERIRSCIVRIMPGSRTYVHGRAPVV